MLTGHHYAASTVYQKFGGGGYLGGVKLVRGYTDAGKSKDSDADKIPLTPTTAGLKGSNVPSGLQLDERQQKLLKRRSAPPSTSRTDKIDEDQATEGSSLGDEDMEAERRRDEKQMQSDYNDRDDENQGREIEHLILVTHGIGQKLGMRSVAHLTLLLAKRCLVLDAEENGRGFSFQYQSTPHLLFFIPLPLFLELSVYCEC